MSRAHRVAVICLPVFIHAPRTPRAGWCDREGTAETAAICLHRSGGRGQHSQDGPQEGLSRAGSRWMQMGVLPSCSVHARPHGRQAGVAGTAPLVARAQKEGDRKLSP